MKWKDEIVEEVRKAKEAYAARLDYDLGRMFEDLKEKEEENPAPRANLKPLKPHGQLVQGRAVVSSDAPRNKPASSKRNSGAS